MTEGGGCSGLWELFISVARSRPSAVAVEVPPGAARAERISIGYAELEARARHIADRLSPRLSPRAEGIIALFLPRAGPDLVAAQLACALLHRPWTFLEPALPDRRLSEIVAEASPDLVVHDATTGERALALGETRLDLSAAESANPPTGGESSRPGALAYVIFTSGSTGRPKGVLIEEAGIENLVRSDLEVFDLGPGDRVAQGSSAAYDSYVEELWLALASGATAVVLDDESLRSGPDLPDFLRRERITVLCPPPTLLRTMGCADPQRELPDLRLLYVGGEALTSDVVTAWAPGRRLVNGYGPTECTVTVMRAEITNDDAITIGGPVSGHEAHVLDEQLADVAFGASGELCIAGPGLARGYLGDSELTRRRFIEHPRHGRLYRTGDLVRRDELGRHHYLGRIDDQVKVRGHRVELTEIETRLAARSGVREAAVCVRNDSIAAFLVAAPELDLAALRREIEAELPEAMRPARYELIASLPRSTGGKIDRRALPAFDRDDEPGEIAASETVALVQRAFMTALSLTAPPQADHDFFAQLGGHSLAAAIAVSRLREDPRGRRIRVRDVYEAPTATALAQRLDLAAGGGRRTTNRRERAKNSLGFASLQLTAIAASFVAISFALGQAVETFSRSSYTASSPPLLLAFVLLGIAGFALLRLVIAPIAAIGVKRLLLGRYREGRQEAFGSFHLRHWLVRAFAATIPFDLVRATGLDLVILRGLGARIGRDVVIERGVDLGRGGWDLLEIGDGAVIGRDAELRPIVMEDGGFSAGPLRVGNGAVLETRAGMGPGSSLGADSRLSALSYLGEASGHERCVLDGVPARATRDEARAVAPAGIGRLSWAAILIGARTLLSALLALPYLAWAIDFFSAVELDSGLAVLNTALVLRLAWTSVALVVIDLSLRLLILRALGRQRSERAAARSFAALRHDLRATLLEGAGRILSGSLFWPSWLRLAGMRIGRGSEISSIMEVVPELISVGRESFFADGIYLGAPRREPGVIEFAGAGVGDRSFLGNHAVIPAGRRVADDVLIGIATPPPGSPRDGTSWFGHPPFELPRRETPEVARALTHEPALHRRLTRLFWETLRFLIPWPPLIVLVGAAVFFLRTVAADPSALGVLAAATLVTASSGAFLVAIVLVSKWLFLGRTRAGTHPLWSCWCSRWDWLYVSWQAWALPVLRPFEGTPLLGFFLRAMGARIGRRVLLGDGFAQLVDPDMIRIGDDATVDGLFQAHTFEDRVLRTAPLDIEAGASTGFGSIMMQGSRLGANAILMPHSLAMKEERLLADQRHLGLPTEILPD